MWQPLVGKLANKEMKWLDMPLRKLTWEKKNKKGTFPQINGKDVSSVADVNELLAEMGDDSDIESVLLLVRTNAGSRFVVVG